MRCCGRCRPIPLWGLWETEQVARGGSGRSLPDRLGVSSSGRISFRLERIIGAVGVVPDLERLLTKLINCLAIRTNSIGNNNGLLLHQLNSDFESLNF
jgi:hypothetical protein